MNLFSGSHLHESVSSLRENNLLYVHAVIVMLSVDARLQAYYGQDGSLAVHGTMRLWLFSTSCAV